MLSFFLRLFAFFAAHLCLLQLATAADNINLIDPAKPRGGFTFDNGQEFPGAVGSLDLSKEKLRDAAVLELRGNFDKGGNYVQAQTPLPNEPIDTLSFWVNIPGGSSQLPIRLIDGTGQCHQLRLKINEKPGWQQIVIPVEEYFKKMGTAGALDLTSQYEKWAGANDGKWHQPGKSLVVLFTKGMGTDGKLLLGDMQLKKAAAKKQVQQTIALDAQIQAGELDWGFNLGEEFPGAKGGIEIAADQPEKGRNALRMKADFTAGGAYVGLKKNLESLQVDAVNAIRFRIKSDNAKKFSLRLVDESGQCHQRKGFAIEADGKWHDVVLIPDKVAGSEHWGGKDDGKFHGGVKLMELMLNPDSADDKQPEIVLSHITADVLLEASLAPSFHVDFEDWKDDGRWKFTGSVKQQKNGWLRFERTANDTEQETSAVSPAFDVRPGLWRSEFHFTSDLHSPDNSYHAAVTLELLDAGGQVTERLPAGIVTGKSDVSNREKTVVLPANAKRARLRIELVKTYGSFELGMLDFARLEVQPIQQRVERILLKSDAEVGNLFLPSDGMVFHVTVEATAPLLPSELALRYSIRDYWGVEQLPSGEAGALSNWDVTLKKFVPRRDAKFVYTAEILLPRKQLEIGKYYELHVAVPQEIGEPVEEYCGFAILPPAASKEFKPEQIPFTIRNWDSRITEYFYLSDRLGLRNIGIWGSWSPESVDQPQAPGIDIVQKLGGKWLTTTPASDVEREGFKRYGEKSLRDGMTAFLKNYANRGLGMIAQGNEPHGTGQKVFDNVRAYKAIYEAVKAFDPKIEVIGTSVEPNEEYFKAGYQNYLDSYDFHIYEHYPNVRSEMKKYRELMKKYDAVKPIHSTELGLNSQGQTRLAVARELIKKCTVFFAEGGSTVSWFTIMYPDSKGRARGEFGDSHCVFDSKFNNYNPRLDAIAYYNLINGLLDKKFVAEKQYDGGAQAFLFRNDKNECLQILWRDEAPKNHLVPLAADGDVELIRIDGSRQKLTPADGGLKLTLSADPVMLLYRSAEGKLAEKLNIAGVMVTITEVNQDRSQVTLIIEGKNVSSGTVTGTIEISGPPGMIPVHRPREDRVVEFALRLPDSPAARERHVLVRPLSQGKPAGEIAVIVP